MYFKGFLRITVIQKIFLLFIGICSSNILFAQGNFKFNRNELLQDLAAAKEDSDKVYILRALGEYYLGKETDSAIFFTKKAVALSQELKFEPGEALSQSTMGRIYLSIGDYTKALQLYFQSLQINERNKDLYYVVFNYNTIGELYIIQGDYQQALNYFFKGISIAENNHFDWQSKLLLNTGKAYNKMGNLDSAKFYILKSYELSKSFKDDYLPGKILYALGEVYFKTGEKAKAMESYRLSEQKSQIAQDYPFICNASLGIAKMLNISGNKDSVLYYARESLAIASHSNLLSAKLDATNFLIDYYKEMKMFDSALSYSQISYVLKDSLVSKEKINEFQKISFSEQLRQQEVEQAKVQYRSKVKMLLLAGGLTALMIVLIFLWRNIWQKQKANRLLVAQKLEIDNQKAEIENSYHELKATQKQLIQSEKMASLGELTAGIAHEIQNPLNFVNNFSEVSNELIKEMVDEINKGNNDEAKAIANDLVQNLEKINHHGKRADAIVKGMLQHSRSSTGIKEPTDINALADEYLRLSYHGLRAKDKTFNATMNTDFDDSIGKINIVPQDVGRVILNLLTNAFYVVTEKKQMNIPGYEPTVSISTKKMGTNISISVKDNGNGIPKKVLEKIFQPFFTTKPTGEGTGLGLSLSYDIITKGHRGELKVETKEGEGTTFTIILPV